MLKNDSSALPITQSDLSGGVLVTGPGAEYTIADPTSEASIGFLNRDQINPLQLRDIQIAVQAVDRLDFEQHMTRQGIGHAAG